MTPDQALRRTVLIVALLNIGYFGVEFTAALAINAVSLFADSVDFLEDASVNLLVFVAIGWTALRRARMGMVLAGLMVVPAVAFLWTLWQKYMDPTTPDAQILTLIGVGALTINLTCAVLLARHRKTAGSLTRAAFLSARNDALANVGIIAAGLFTALHPSVWPDLLVGLAIAAMNLNAAAEVWETARSDEKAART